MIVIIDGSIIDIDGSNLYRIELDEEFCFLFNKDKEVFKDRNLATVISKAADIVQDKTIKQKLLKAYKDLNFIIHTVALVLENYPDKALTLLEQCSSVLITTEEIVDVEDFAKTVLNARSQIYNLVKNIKL